MKLKYLSAFALFLMFSCEQKQETKKNGGSGNSESDDENTEGDDEADGDADADTNAGNGKDSGNRELDVPISDLDPGKSPGQNFDLSLWKLTLPVDEDGGFEGGAAEIKPIPPDYKHEEYFYSSTNGGMVFRTPAGGATTSSSGYSRTELRELNAEGDNISWTAAEGGVLQATLSVDELAKVDEGGFGKVIVGQIHGPSDELCRLYYDNGDLYFANDIPGSGSGESDFFLRSSEGKQPNIPLGEGFSYEIKVDPTAKKLLVSAKAKDGTVYQAEDTIHSDWDDAGLYFKAGNYLQVTGPGGKRPGTGHAKVTFFSLPKPTH